MVPKARDILGSVVRSLRERSRRSRADLAHACHISESQLRNIENGHRSPGQDTLVELERELGTGGLLADLTMGGGNHLGRRLILQSLVMMGAAIPSVYLDETPGSGPPQLAAVRSMTSALRDLDNRHGGAHVHYSVAAYLNHVALPMLSNTSETFATCLRSAVAELALLAGWSAFDAGVHVAARAYFRQALLLAEQARNGPLVCETIIAASNQAAILRDGATALDAGTAALDVAVGLADPAMIGEARMAVAHALSLLGDGRVVARSIVRAHQDFDRADRPDAPEWIGHLGHAWLDGRVAQCMYLLGDHENATEAAERTARVPRQLPRGRALNVGHTALVMFAADRPEEACGYAHRALESAEHVRSARIAEYVRRLEVAATAVQVPATDDLLAALSATGGVVRCGSGSLAT